MQGSFGAMLKTVGAVIAWLFGLGMLACILLGMSEPQSEYGPMLAGFGVAIGALPFLIGVGFFFWGRALSRPAEPPEEA